MLPYIECSYRKGDLTLFTIDLSAHRSKDLKVSDIHTSDKPQLGAEQTEMNSH